MDLIASSKLDLFIYGTVVSSEEVLSGMEGLLSEENAFLTAEECLPVSGQHQTHSQAENSAAFHLALASPLLVCWASFQLLWPSLS